MQIYNDAVCRLTTLLDNTGPLDRAGRRFTSGQIKSHSKRVEVIKMMAEANQLTFLFVPPTSLSAADELQIRRLPNGQLLLPFQPDA